MGIASALIGAGLVVIAVEVRRAAEISKLLDRLDGSAPPLTAQDMADLASMPFLPHEEEAMDRARQAEDRRPDAWLGYLDPADRTAFLERQRTFFA